jgi:CRISPR-associated protein Csm3
MKTMKLTRISKLTGTIELVTGLHIGSGNAEMHIGGTDNPVVKNPVNQEPYIPGSSLKGKMRSLMEWSAGVVGVIAEAENGKGLPLGFKHLKLLLDPEQQAKGKLILQIFGGAPESESDQALVNEIGPTRLAFWDCNLSADWVARMREQNLLLTETKMENTIDRIRGVAEHPRNTERVPAGTRFEFNLTIRLHDDEDLLDEVLQGLKLVELTGLGGSGSRGYGKVRFAALKLDQEPIQDRYAALQPV